MHWEKSATNWPFLSDAWFSMNENSVAVLWGTFSEEVTDHSSPPMKENTKNGISATIASHTYILM